MKYSIECDDIVYVECGDRVIAFACASAISLLFEFKNKFIKIFKEGEYCYTMLNGSIIKSGF